AFPKFDEQYLIESSFSYPISINGKVRAQMEFSLDVSKEEIEKPCWQRKSCRNGQKESHQRK
ncbi:MAG: hypothetical protein HC819_24350, partial [Cyclobacteriaceae bacterium]|nr:hypothetical protein [Cyclobacteriaceae bacterium]